MRLTPFMSVLLRPSYHREALLWEIRGESSPIIFNNWWGEKESLKIPRQGY
jgi:hypothetical protein